MDLKALGSLKDLAGKTFSSTDDAKGQLIAGLASKLPGSVAAAASGGGRAGPSSRRSVLEAMQSRSDPLMNFNWYVDMPTVRPFGQSSGSQTLGWEFVEEITLPFIEFEQVSNYQAGKNVHFPKNYSLGTLGLKLYEDSDGTSTNYLNTWQRAMFNTATGLQNYPREFKKVISVWVLDVSKLTVMCLEYAGCWPTRPEPMNLSSGSSERVVVGAEFSVDSINMKFGKFAQGQVPSLMETFGADFPSAFTNLPSAFPSNFSNFSF